MSYAVLHAHSEFSARDSIIRVEDLPKLAAERGWSACAITDHGAIEGIPYFMKECRKLGIKPIAGCELYISCPDAKIDGTDRFDKFNHLTVLCKNAKGWSSLMSVLSYAHKHHYDARRQKAAVPIDIILERLTDCVVLSGCFSSPFWRGTDEAPSDLVRFKERFKDDFYLEVQALWDWDKQIDLNRAILDTSEALGIPIVVTPDCHFGSQDESQFHEALLALASHKVIGSPDAWRFSTKQIYLGTPDSTRAALANAGLSGEQANRALEMTKEINEKITDWSWNDLPAPRLPEIKGDMPALCREGLQRHGLLGKPAYDVRLEKELGVFMKAGLDQYFLLVRHCLNLFRENGAEIGPRGSVGGSLVAFALGITSLDPIFHGLSFERFYAPGRKGWPDIDIDVDVKFRERVPEILRAEFGEDNVAQISNYACFGLRMAVKDAARVYGIKLFDDSKAWEDDKELKGTKDPNDVLKIDPGKELAQKSPEAIEFAKKLYGRIRQYGAHAGGFVITADPLSQGRSCIVSRGKDKALCWDMELAEEIGFIKFDFLGIDSLSAIKVVGDAAKIDWDKVPLDDAEVYKDLSEGRTAGVPQFLTSGMRAFVEKLKPNKFEDLVWANAAFRPGALGQMTPVELAETYRRDPGAIIVYQEEVMQLCVDLAGFSWTEADAVRKTIAKSKGIEEMKKYEEKFIAGCIKTSAWVEEDARSFWKMLYNFGRYSFNRAHANSYSWSAYRIAWAKRHHPKETFSALANADPSDSDLELLLDEAPDFGVELLPPDPNKSDLEWKVEGEGIRTPMTQMLGIDLRISKAVIKRRTMHGEFKDVADFNHKMKGIKYPLTLGERAFSGKSIAESFELPVKKNPKENLLPAGFVDEIKGCTACALRANCKAPVPPRFGKNNIMLVGEAPGWSEDKRGTPFIGKSGQLLMDLLEDQGITRDDLTITNATSCFPNGDPNYDDKTCSWAQKTIGHLQPPLVLVVGKRAWHKLSGGKEAIGKVNGTIREVNGSKLMACIHPAAILRDMDLLPEIGRTIRKFAKLYRILVPIKKKKEEEISEIPEIV